MITKSWFEKEVLFHSKRWKVLLFVGVNIIFFFAIAHFLFQRDKEWNRESESQTLSIKNLNTVNNQLTTELNKYKSNVQEKKLPNLSKVIDGIRYTVEENTNKRYVIKANGDELTPEKQELGRTLIAVMDENTRDFWLDFKHTRILTVQDSKVTGQGGRGSYQMIFLYEPHFGSYSGTDIKLLKAEDTSVYDGNTILDVKKDQIIVAKRGGDGCGGSGSIKRLTISGQETTLLKYSVGCFSYEGEQGLTRFGGMLKNKLIVGTGKRLTDQEQKETNDHFFGVVNTVYLLDPYTMQKTPVSLPFEKELFIDLADIQQLLRDNYISLSDLNPSEIVFFGYKKGLTKQQYYALNVETNQVRLLPSP